MLLRVRLPSGATKRVAVQDNTSQTALEAEIQELASLPEVPSLHTDAAFKHPFALSRAKHGDLLYVHRQFVPATEPGAGGSSASDVAMSTEGPSGENGAGSEKGESKEEEEPWRPRCRHGPRGMCEHCAPKEDKGDRYRAELTKWNGRGMSIAVMEAREALKAQVKPQAEPHASAACVDSSAANAFQAYLGACGFSQHRFGVCFGTVTPSNDVEVHAIHEPPQQGDDDAYALNESEEAHTRAHKLAQLLGLRPVGIVFSARQRKAVLSGRDVVIAARYASTLSPEERKTFIVMKVGVVSEAGETAFEAYQISDLAIELYEKDVFAPEEKQKPNSGKVLCAKEVIVEGRDTKKVHTEFFLNNIPIKTLESWLQCKFPIENRELRPQRGADIAASTSNSEEPYWKRLSDFHLLLYLAGTFGIDTDMPAVVSAIREHKDVEEGYRLMIQSLSAS